MCDASATTIVPGSTGIEVDGRHLGKRPYVGRLAGLCEAEPMQSLSSELTSRKDTAAWVPLTQGALDPQQSDAFAPMFKALGDPVRLRLLSMIASAGGGEVCVCDLTGEFSLTGPTISHHLKVLREAGLVDSDRRGTWVYYRLVPAALTWLAGLLAVGAAISVA
jgi:ArsR family transcriptional regulator, arsenate/arsenite/antimonite-responsive transcriptional repressor